MSAIAALLPDGRLHLQHGPIDCLCRAWGEPGDVRAGYAQAAAFFAEVLNDLCAELPLLRSPLPTRRPAGSVARAMHAACMPFADCFITPMAAVAGAVADAVLAAMVKGRDLTRAYVNNGGDIAFHLTPGASLRCGLVTDLASYAVADLPVRVMGGLPHRAADDVHNSVMGDAHDRVMGNVHDRVMGNAHDRVMGNAYDRVMGNVHDRVMDNVHDRVMDNVHDCVMGDVHDCVMGDVHDRVMGDVHNRVMGDAHDRVMGNAHDRVMGNVHDRVMGNAYDRVMGNAHDRVMGNVHNRVMGDAYDRVMGNMHDRVMAGLVPATHDLRGRDTGKSWVTGPSPVMTHLTNPHSANPHSANSHLTNPHSANSHLTNPHLTNPHLTNPHLANSHLANSCLDGSFLLTFDHPARGLATSGRACKGHGGRSFSFGIADSVSILARTAARADAAATIVGNAVDLPGHAAIDRRPASDIDPASDLGDRLITFNVGPLDRDAIETALDAGETMADTLLRDSLIEGAVLTLRRRFRVRNPSLLEVA
jgi:ApbE superfamily uncharacterized protein (UPF0280 family)